MRLDYAQIAQAMEAIRWGGPAEVRLSDARPWSEQPLQWAPASHLTGLRVLVELPQTLAHGWQLLRHLVTGGTWDSRPEYDPAPHEWYETLDAKWGHHRRQAMRDQDQTLVNLWRADGWLSGEVRVHAAGPQRSYGTGAVTIGSLADRIHDVMLNIRPGGDLPNLAQGEKTPAGAVATPVFNQWLTLGHEVAHTMFVGEIFPFQPSAASLRRLGVDPAEVAEQVKTWNLDLFSLGTLGPFYRQLDEAFADVYGTMMVLSSAHFHPQVMQEVRLRQRLRAAAVADPFPSWAKREQLDRYEVTGPALQRLLDTQADWAHLSPDQQRQHALTLVSDAWLEVAAQHTQQEPGWANRLNWSLNTHPDFHDRMLAAFCEGPTAPDEVLAYFAPLADTVGHRLWSKWLPMWRREHPTLPALVSTGEPSLGRREQKADAHQHAVHAFVDPWMDRWLGTQKGKRARDAWCATLNALEARVTQGYAPSVDPAIMETTPPERRRRRMP